MQEKLNAIMSETRAYWTVVPKSLFHNTISLLTSQKVRFAQSRKIRKNLYNLLKEDEYTVEAIRKVGAYKLTNCGFTKAQLVILDELIHASKIKGIGNH